MRKLILLAVVFLPGCHKPIKAPHPVQRPHFAAMTAAAGIQVSVTLLYDDGTPFAGHAELRDSCNTLIASAPFDTTGNLSVPVQLDPKVSSVALAYDPAGGNVLTKPVDTAQFDLSQITSVTVTGTIRKADNALIQPYSLSAP